MNDLRYSLRQLIRRPGFSALAIVTLALGIGATTAVFGVVHAVLLEPLPYPESDRLVALWHRATFQGIPNDGMNLSPPLYFAYAEHSETLESVGAWSDGTANVTGVGAPEQVRTLVATHDFLPTLGVQPMLGRWFTAEDDAPDAAETVILSFAYWQRRFGGDPSILGRTVDVDSRPRQVIGVMPRRFTWTFQPDLILPQRFDRSAERVDLFNYFGVGRLEPGVEIGAVDADLARALAASGDELGVARLVETLDLAPAVRPLKQDFVGDVGDVLWALLGSIGLLLLIACANVANLLLVRVDARSDELAIRTALGATSSGIARLLLQESVVLGVLGGALGFVLAFGALEALAAIGPEYLPRRGEIGVDAAVLAFAAAVAIGSALAFGSVPALRYARRDVALPGGGRGASMSRERHRAQNALIVLQCTLAFTLLVAAGLMLRSFATLLEVEPGFSLRAPIETVRITIPEGEVPEPERVVRIQHEMLERIAALPGVESVAFATALPLEGSPNANPISVEGVTPDGDFPPVRRTKIVSPGYFATLGTPLLAGRDFDWREVHDAREVAIVSERMARETWGSPAAALGKRIRVGVGTQWREVIGVVDDVHEDGTSVAAPPMVYWRAGIHYWFGPNGPADLRRQITFAIKTPRAGTESFRNEVEQAIWSVNRNVPLAAVRTLQQIYADSLSSTSFTLVMLGIAGLIGLVLGIVGIYGVVAYAATRRKRELGVRLALGARREDVERLLVRHGLVLATVGVALGIGASAALMRLATSLLFEVSPLDPATYAAGAVVLLGAAALASWLPARRALAADPIGALRAE